ncbi:unnamed protein product [Wuchereria bancrofti]|uniref:Uncharacterized protein n=1 Tax=Wuchereria bancrofti TaxID=6293 RepID=A0A3P7F121_WUCBA|nr:unnamed protein product [Wuchereria bancrofti]
MIKIYASYQEVLRCIGVTAYYFYIIIDPIGIQPNRLFMMTIYISSAVFWSVYIVSHINVVLHKNTGKNSKIEQISTIQNSESLGSKEWQQSTVLIFYQQQITDIIYGRSVLGSKTQQYEILTRYIKLVP